MEYRSLQSPCICLIISRGEPMKNSGGRAGNFRDFGHVVKHDGCLTTSRTCHLYLLILDHSPWLPFLTAHVGSSASTSTIRREHSALPCAVNCGPNVIEILGYCPREESVHSIGDRLIQVMESSNRMICRAGAKLIPPCRIDQRRQNRLIIRGQV